ncbi:MAG: sulfotransferase domain-containing protein, partial [Microthrixaceae bacterium]
MTFEQAKIDLFLIGAQKCGTTTVSNDLCSHFRYTRAMPAEPRFFLDSGTLPEGWGLSFGAVAGSGTLLDDSTAYSNLPHSALVPTRVYEHNPDARIIYCDRNPVDRIRSAVHHRFVKEGWRGT